MTVVPTTIPQRAPPKPAVLVGHDEQTPESPHASREAHIGVAPVSY